MPQPTILVVDDSLVQRIALAATLQQAGFVVEQAVSGQQALELAASGRVSLMLLDVVLPDIPGYEVCRRLKADPATAPVPVVLVSALGSVSKERVIGLDCGADGYLVKPADAVELLAQVRALLRVRQAEEALRQSEELYRVLAEGIPHLVWMLGAGGEPLYCNRRCLEYAGVPPEQAASWDWQSLVHPEDRPRVGRSWEHSLSSGEPGEAEYRARRADGVYHWHIVRFLPLRGAEGGVAKWFGTSTDIDGQKRAEESLREADRRKDEFLAMLAHELRNPLAPIRNAAHLLQFLAPGDPNLQRTREMIARQVTQLTRLVDDLLDVSRFTTGKIKLHTEVVDVATVIARAVETSRPLIDARKHQLTVSLPPTSVPIEADVTRLAQVVSNLLNNAAKYTEEGGHIWLTVEHEAADVVIRVRDSGMGIPTEMLPRIFELFTQVDSTLERAQGGLGIGLTLVKKLIELHGGSVTASSEGPGKGSEFVVRLPRPGNGRVSP